jgi:hypothetical protein
VFRVDLTRKHCGLENCLFIKWPPSTKLEFKFQLLPRIEGFSRCKGAAKEIGLEVNADKTKYMVMARDQNAGRNHTMKIDNSSIERVEEFKYKGCSNKDRTF